MSRNDPVSRLGCSNYVRLIDPIFRGAEESPAHRQLFRRLIIGDFHPCRLEPGSSDTHRINVCARFGIRKTLKFKAFVPRTHRNASKMPASPFLFENPRARARRRKSGSENRGRSRRGAVWRTRRAGRGAGEAPIARGSPSFPPGAAAPLCASKSSIFRGQNRLIDFLRRL